MADEIGLVGNMGEDDAFLLPELAESKGRKEAEVWEDGVKREVPLVLLPLDSLVVMEVLDSPGFCLSLVIMLLV